MKRITFLSATAPMGILACALLVHLSGSAAAPPPPPPPPPPQPQSTVVPPGKYVDADGTIHLPEDYRLKWTHLGSWYVEGDKMGGGGGGDMGDMHDVYAEPETVAEFRKTGKWPQGATLVKEIRKAQQGKLTTGQASWDAEIKQWFVMVKDNKKTFPDNPNWGRGWGWALFLIDDPKKNTSADYKIDCIACHVPAEKTDWVFEHGYPILREKEGPFKKYAKEIYEANQPTDKPAGK